MKFEKPALKVSEQIELLRSRGMQFDDVSLAENSLIHLNYYRLRGYWSHFEVTSVEKPHEFQPGTTFEHVLSLYQFDRQLKTVLLEAIETIEISLRTRWAYELSIKYGSHAHLKPEIFKSAMLYAKLLGSARVDLDRSKETFIKHYRETYSDPDLPPIWSLTEVMTFGQISIWLDNLRHSTDRHAITKDYGFDEAIICAFMHHLSHVRNICAHYGRLWNRRLTIKMQIPRHPDEYANLFNRKQPEKLYNTLVMISMILKEISLKNQWAVQINNLLKKQSSDLLMQMGFPESVCEI